MQIAENQTNEAKGFFSLFVADEHKKIITILFDELKNKRRIADDIKWKTLEMKQSTT